MTDREKLVDLLVEFPTFPASMDYIRQFEMIVLFAEWLADKGVTFATDTKVGGKWIPASEPPEEYRDECGELIPFLVCADETEYPFRAMYDGKKWGDGLFEITAKWWMPLPEPPKGE